MATTKIHLRESVTEAPTKVGNRWRVIVARPGQGSSGKYSAEVLEQYAHTIVPAKGQSFLNHDFERNPKDMIGFYPEAAKWDAEEQAVVAELEVFSHWKDFVEEVGPHCGISLYAMGEIDEEGNVTAFQEDAYNGADLVSRPGLEGSGLDAKLYEEAHKAATTEAHLGLQEKDNKMDDKDIEAIKALTVAVQTLVSAKQVEVEESSQVEADEKAIAEALEAYSTAVEAIESARESLFPSQVKNLMAEAKAGKDVAPLIEAAKTVYEEAHAEVSTESAATGRVLEGASKDYRVPGWSK